MQVGGSEVAGTIRGEAISRAPCEHTAPRQQRPLPPGPPSVGRLPDHRTSPNRGLRPGKRRTSRRPRRRGHHVPHGQMARSNRTRNQSTTPNTRPNQHPTPTRRLTPTGTGLLGSSNLFRVRPNASLPPFGFPSPKMPTPGRRRIRMRPAGFRVHSPPAASDTRRPNPCHNFTPAPRPGAHRHARRSDCVPPRSLAGDPPPRRPAARRLRHSQQRLRHSGSLRPAQPRQPTTPDGDLPDRRVQLG